MKNKLWVEKYRPHTVDEYVFVDETQRQQVCGWIRDRSIPHLLLSGDPGTGKTALAKVLIKELGVQEYDLLEINASRENSVDMVRNRIVNFVETIPFGDFKIVFLDEADYLSPSAQASLRSDMETYEASTRFILTCNYQHKIMAALRSRCYEFHIAKPDQVEFTTRAAKVLVSEGVDFDLDVLDDYVRVSYPDLRKCLKQLQVNSSTGTLLPPDQSKHDEDSLLITATTLFKQHNPLEARKCVLQYLSTNPTRAEDIYKWMYMNLDLWGTTQQSKDAAIITIRNGLANLPLVGIPEIAISATLCELSTT